MVDALALTGDEGRGKLRKASGRSKHPLIRGLPNWQTTHSKAMGAHY
jgi:hypothetical protein